VLNWLRPVAPVQLSMHEGFGSYMETTLQLATNQGVVLPPRSSAAKSVLQQVGSQHRRRTWLHSEKGQSKR
jgi:hypothetical protein